ncbi:MAG: phosphoethanolamine transferase [Bacteroidaceae bacterium]|nr:phosphoethanolamine transferase [Bacteroidaceae bacterium]
MEQQRDPNSKNRGGEAYTPLFGRMALLFLFAYIGATIIYNIKQRTLKLAVKIFFYFITVTLYTIAFFLQTNFQLEICNPTCFTLLAETTSTESREFIDQYIFSSSIIPTLKKVFIYLFIIICSEILWNKIINRPNKQYTIAKILITITLTPILLFASYSTNIYWKIYNAKSTDEISFLTAPTDPISSIFLSHCLLNTMKQSMEKFTILNKAIYNEAASHNTSNDSLNIVVVIGESYIKSHSRLYGYNLNTTPNLSKEQNKERLFVFNDVITSSNSTSLIMKNIVCCNNSSSGEDCYDYPSFLTIFKQAGYDVYFWDNQKSMAENAVYSYTLNSFLYNPEICKVAYTKTNDQSFQYDEQIVDSFEENIGEPPGKHNIVLFHLNGQHTMPNERYPHNTFKHFTADSVKNDQPYITDEMKEQIAHYDNATLYNDYILNRIIRLFENSNTMLVYFSDHGEEVYDYRPQIGRTHGDITANVLKYQYDVPFMIWCSDIFQKNHPETIKNIRQAVNHPFMIDNICNMLFKVAGIDTPYYRDSLNLISPNYRCGERIIQQKYNYEYIRNSLDK